MRLSCASLLYCYLTTLAGNIQLYHHVISWESYDYQKVWWFSFHIECCPKREKEKSHGGQKKEEKKEKRKEPWRPPKIKIKRGNTAMLLFHTSASKSEHPYFSFESFHVFISIIMWGTFHYRTWLVYSKDEPPQKCSRSSWASKLDAPPLVPLESFIHL